jgi:hypothetical protein
VNLCHPDPGYFPSGLPIVSQSEISELLTRAVKADAARAAGCCRILGACGFIVPVVAKLWGSCKAAASSCAREFTEPSTALQSCIASVKGSLMPKALVSAAWAYGEKVRTKTKAAMAMLRPYEEGMRLIIPRGYWSPCVAVGIRGQRARRLQSNAPHSRVVQGRTNRFEANFCIAPIRKRVPEIGVEASKCSLGVDTLDKGGRYRACVPFQEGCRPAIAAPCFVRRTIPAIDTGSLFTVQNMYWRSPAALSSFSRFGVGS